MTRRTCEREHQPDRSFRKGMFVGMLAVLVATLFAISDPNHRLNGLLFGGIGGALIGIALLAWPTNRDYPNDYIDKTLD